MLPEVASAPLLPATRAENPIDASPHREDIIAAIGCWLIQPKADRISLPDLHAAFVMEFDLPPLPPEEGREVALRRFDRYVRQVARTVSFQGAVMRDALFDAGLDLNVLKGKAVLIGDLRAAFDAARNGTPLEGKDGQVVLVAKAADVAALGRALSTALREFEETAERFGIVPPLIRQTESHETRVHLDVAKVAKTLHGPPGPPPRLVEAREVPPGPSTP